MKEFTKFDHCVVCKELSDGEDYGYSLCSWCAEYLPGNVVNVIAGRCNKTQCEGRIYTTLNISDVYTLDPKFPTLRDRLYYLQDEGIYKTELH